MTHDPKATKDLSATLVETPTTMDTQRILSPFAQRVGGSSTIAGRYQVLSLLGHGGEGAVYRVYDQQLDETVALKTLRSLSNKNKTQVERFKQEVRCSRKISHPNVARVFDLGEEDGHFFLTMEYINGITLETWMEENASPPLSEALLIARQLCEGLKAAHTARVLHRDFKPENIMLDQDAANTRVVLTDFGVAKLLQPKTAEPASAQQKGVLVGTPAYMAPEQLHGEADIDGRADIYALGVVLYELFSGTKVWQGRDLAHLLYLRLNEPPPPPLKEKRPDLPDVLSDLIERCMQDEPARRYERVGQILNMLTLLPNPPKAQSFEAPLHPLETERLASLEALHLLDTPGEERFDRITRLATKLASAPMAMVSLLSHDRQWNKSVQGPLGLEVPKVDAFCFYTILGVGPLISEDTLVDCRFSSKTAVLQKPNIRFYCGIPLHDPSGLPVATLCVMDTKPRTLEPSVKEALEDLARMAEAELALVQLEGEQVRLRAELSQKARRDAIDPMTRVWNEEYIMRILERELRAQMPGELSIILLTLDNIKSVYSLYHRDIGDAMLSSVTQRIRAKLQPKDALGRYAQDTFLLILPGTQRLDALALAERLRRSIREPVEHSSVSLRVSISAGVAALAPGQTKEAKQLLDEAKAAMEEAQYLGKDTVVLAAIGANVS